MTHGHSEIDVHHSDIARFYPHQRTRATSAPARRRRSTRPTASCTPREQWDGERGKRLAPMHAAETRRRRGVLRDRGLGAADVVRVQRGPARRVRRRRHAARARVGQPVVVADHQRRAPRDARARRHRRPVRLRDLRHRRARRGAGRPEASSSRRPTSPTGRVLYTPVLDAKGGFRSDLTVMRLAHDRYRVVTGGAHGMADLKWFADHLPARRGDRRPDLGVHHDRAVGPEGPRHPRPAHRRRHLARRLPVPDLPRRSSWAASPCWPRGSPTSASWAGSCTSRWSRAPRCGELLHEAGQPDGAVPVGIGVYGTTGRLEKGYRAFGFELDGGAHDHRGGDGPAARSRTPTSSAARPTSPSAPPTRRRCCAR